MTVVAEYDKSHPLYGKTVVMSSFRDKEFGLELKKIGANVGTNIVIPILTLEEFRKKYIGL